MMHRRTRLLAAFMVMLVSLCVVTPAYADVFGAKFGEGGPEFGFGSVKDLNDWIGKATKQGGGKDKPYYVNLNQDMNAKTSFVVPAQTTMIVNLNGHVWNRNLSKAKSGGHIILVEKGGKLTINGGKEKSTKTLMLWGASGTKYKQAVDNVSGVLTGGYSTNKSGGIDVMGSARVTLNDVTIAGCRAEQNFGSDGYGGGIWIEGDDVELNLNSSIITGNYAYNDGGGIYSKGSLTNIFLTNSRVDYNYAKRNGGGIATTKANTLISGNTKTTVNGNSCGGSYGGGVYARDGVAVKGFTVKGNKSPEAGGGVYIAGDGGSVDGLVVTNNTSDKGGGVYFGWITNMLFSPTNSLSNCVITNNSVTNNSTWGKGAGVFVEGGKTRTNSKSGKHVLKVSGTTVIKDNGEDGYKAGNLVLNTGEGHTRYANINVVRGSDVHLSYVTMKDDIIELSNAEVDNCIQYVSCDHSDYEVTYNSSTKKMYLRKKGTSDEKAGKTYDAYKKNVTTKTINVDDTKPVDSGQKFNGWTVMRGFIRYPSFEDTAHELVSPFYYSDGYFFDNPVTYNKHLATCSISMAMSGFYLNVGGADDYTIKHAAARQFMSDIGCDEQKTWVNDFNVQKPGADTIGVTIGYKKLKNADGTDSNKILIPIAVRGAGYESEWASNVSLGGGTGEAQGFGSAGRQVFKEVQQFLARNDLTGDKLKNVVFWVAGYSRAGATANLTSKRLVDAYGDKAKVFGYTFEAPQGGVDNEETSNPASYFCIHNTINNADLVALVGPSEMGFKRYGVDHYVPGTETAEVRSFNTYTPTNAPWDVLTDGSYSYPLVTFRADNYYTVTRKKGAYTDEYPPKRDEMLKQLAAVDPPLNFTDEYVAKYILGTITANQQDNAEDFIRLLLRRAQLYIIPSREAYANKYQKAFAETMSAVMGMHPANSRAFMERASTVTARLGIADMGFGGDVVYKALVKWDEVKPDEKRALANEVYKRIEKTGAFEYMGSSDLNKFRTNLPILLDFVGSYANAEVKDTMSSTTLFTSMRTTLTAASNLMRIMQNHYPEVNLAWARAQDSYYEGEASTHYMIAAPGSVAMPEASKLAKGQTKGTKLQEGADKTNIISGKRRIVLDVSDRKGEAIYYQVLDGSGQVVSKNTCKNGYDIYRGGVNVNAEPGTKWTIKAYASFYDVKSAESTFVINGGAREHEVTLQESSNGKMQRLTLVEGATKEIKAAVADAHKDDKQFVRWQVIADRGGDVTKEVFAEEAITKPETTLTMPKGDTPALSKDYTLTVRALFEPVPRVERLYITNLDSPSVGRPVDALRKTAGIRWTEPSGTIVSKSVDNVVWESAPNGDGVSTDWTATVTVPSSMTKRLKDNCTVFVYTGGTVGSEWAGFRVERDTVEVAKGENGDLIVKVHFTTTPELLRYSVSMTAYDANNLDNPVLRDGETQAQVIARAFEYYATNTTPPTFTLEPPAVAGAEFDRWSFDTDVLTQDSGNTNVFTFKSMPAKNAVIHISALYKPIVSGLTINLTPTAENPLPNEATVTPILKNDIFSTYNPITCAPTWTEEGNYVVATVTPDFGEWAHAYASDNEVSIHHEESDSRAFDEGTAYLYFEKGIATQQVTVVNGPDAGTDSAVYSWLTGETYHVSAKADDDKVFTGWAAYKKDDGAEVTADVFAGEEVSQPVAELTVPDYDVTITADYNEKPSTFAVGAAAPTSPTQDASGLADEGTISWTDYAGASRSRHLPVSWSLVKGETKYLTNEVYQDTTYKATMRMDVATAQEFKTAFTQPAAPEGATGIEATRNADGSITVVVTFHTEQSVGKPMPQDPQTYEVSVSARDVNIPDRSASLTTETYAITMNAEESTNNETFVVSCPNVAGAILCDWEIAEGDNLKLTGHDDDAGMAGFEVQDENPAGKSYHVYALYKPVVSGLTISLTPTEQTPQPTEARVTPVLKNSSFSTIEPVASEAKWAEESSSVVATVTPDFGVWAHAYAPDNEVAIDHAESARHAFKNGTAYLHFNKGIATQQVTVVNGPDEGADSTTYTWLTGETYRVSAKADDNQVFTGWTAKKNEGGDDVTADVFSGEEASQPVAQIRVPDYDITITATYKEKPDAFAVGVAAPTSPTQDASGLAATGTVSWTDHNGGPQSRELPVSWSRVSGEQQILTNEVYEQVTYKATMRIDAATAQAFKTEFTQPAAPEGATGIEATRNADGSITVVVTFVTGQGVGKPVPLDPPTYEVEVVACDVNDPGRAPLKSGNNDIKEIYSLATDGAETAINEVFFISYPDVTDAEFCGWEIVKTINGEEVDEEPLAQIAIPDDEKDEGYDLDEDLTITAGFDVVAENPAGHTYQIRALYKPLIDRLTVTLAKPEATKSLVTKVNDVQVVGTPRNAVFNYAVAPAVTALAWDPEGTEGKADYDTIYRASITLGEDTDDAKKQFSLDENTKVEWQAPASLSGQSDATSGGDMTMEAAGDGDTSEGPNVETSLMIGENGETVVGILFPETDTEPLNLLIVVDPADATNVSHGTEPASVRPATAELILTGGATMEVPITWVDLVREYEGDEFNPAIWKATGTVDLTDVNNPNKVSNVVTMYIYVNPPEAEARVYAEAPYPSLETGVYEKEQSIYLYTDEEGGTIFYTTDSSGDNFTEYTGEPIELTRDATLLGEDDLLIIRAFTRVDGKEDSPEVGLAYGLENSIPVPEGDEFVYNGEAQVGVWGTDYYKLDDFDAKEVAIGSVEEGDGIDENGDAVATNVGTYQVTAKIGEGLTWEVEEYSDFDNLSDEEKDQIENELLNAKSEDDYLNLIYGAKTSTKDQVVTFTITPASIRDCDISDVEDQIYDGTAKTPEPRITYLDRELQKDRDYTLAYENNVEEGKGKVTITGKGNFKDETSIEFFIRKSDDQKDITYVVTSGNNGTWTCGSNKTYDLTFERNVDPDSTFSHFTGVKVDGKELKLDEDYTAESGSVIIHLAPEYLSTLEVDTHELEAMFDDATNRPVARFTIEEASDENDGPNGSDSSNGSKSPSAPSGPKSTATTVRRETLPYTGDNLWWWPFG